MEVWAEHYLVLALPSYPTGTPPLTGTWLGSPAGVLCSSLVSVSDLTLPRTVWWVILLPSCLTTLRTTTRAGSSTTSVGLPYPYSTAIVLYPAHRAAAVM